MISILKKELRDCLKWVPAGMLIAIVMVWRALPDRVDYLYYTMSSLTASIGWSAALIAFGLGLLQSLIDIRNDARGYLLHRPVRRRHIFWAKLAAGFIAYVFALIPSVLLAVIYLNSKGLTYLPVSGWQIIPGLLLSLGVFLLHPIGMWIGNREAKWVGTRVLPLAGIVPILLVIYSVYEMGLGELSYRYQMLVTVVMWAVHIFAFIVIVLAARHAFCNRQMLPPANGKNAYSWASILGLTFSSIVVLTAVVAFIVETVDTDTVNYSRQRLLMNADGEFQQVKTEHARWNYNEVKRFVRPADELEDDFTPVNDQWKFAEFSVITEGQRDYHSWFKQFHAMGSFGSGSEARGPVSLFSHRGRLLAYERGHLSAIITPKSVSREGEIPKDRFQQLAMFSRLQSGEGVQGQLGANPLLVDATGVYQFDSNTFEIYQLLPESVDRACMLFADDQSPASLWTVNGDTLTQHSISAIDDGIDISKIELLKSHVVEMPLIKIDGSKSYKVDMLDSETNYSISIFRGEDGRHGYVSYQKEGHFYGMLEEDGGVTKVGTVVIPTAVDSSQDNVALGIPPITVYALSIWELLFGRQYFRGMIGFALVQTLLAAVGTFLLCKWLDLSARCSWIWTIVALFAGWGTCLAVVACHRRLVKEACSHCKTPTRVDAEACTQCGKEWMPPKLDEIEIFDDVVQAA